MESVFETKEKFFKMIDKWKEVTNDPELSKGLELKDFAIYALLRGRDWRKCLSPHSREETVDSIEYSIIKSNYLSLWAFGDTVTTDMIAKLREQGIKRFRDE